MPPTTTIPCTKLEPDMSGVCKMAGTLHKYVKGYKARDRGLVIHRDPPLSWNRNCWRSYRDVFPLSIMSQRGFSKDLIVPIDLDDVLLHHQGK
jgi:hypothetical protein